MDDTELPPEMPGFFDHEYEIGPPIGGVIYEVIAPGEELRMVILPCHGKFLKFRMKIYKWFYIHAVPELILGDWSDFEQEVRDNLVERALHHITSKPITRKPPDF